MTLTVLNVLKTSFQCNKSKHKSYPCTCHEGIQGSAVPCHPFLTSTLGAGEWPSSGSGHFTPSTQWIGGWVGPTACLDIGEEKKLYPCPEMNYSSSVLHPNPYSQWLTGLSILCPLAYRSANTMSPGSQACQYYVPWLTGLPIPHPSPLF
jgi:hypothetical protein